MASDSARRKAQDERERHDDEMAALREHHAATMAAFTREALEAAEARAEAVAILETASRTSRRVFGPSHPITVDIELVLTRARRILTIK